MGFEITLGAQPEVHVYPLIIVAILLMPIITLSYQDVLLYKPAQCISLDVLMLLYHPVICLLTPHNPEILPYVFYYTFVFLVTFRISYLYISSGYVPINLQVMYPLCSQHGYIATKYIFLFLQHTKFYPKYEFFACVYSYLFLS